MLVWSMKDSVQLQVHMCPLRYQVQDAAEPRHREERQLPSHSYVMDSSSLHA